MTPYIYTPLDEEAKEVRLMTLLPGTRPSEIRIVLENIALAEYETPQYEALSYVWGSAEALINIHIGHSDETLGVTQNLATALPYLRYKDKPRRLWIDAICVDQQNLAERSQQVLRMCDMYWMAERVVIWLGPEYKSSKFAIEMLKNLSCKIQVDWKTTEMKPACQEDPDWADSNVRLPYDKEALDAIHDLLNHSWFERLWIQQEIRLANQSAVVMCGFDTILWQKFCDATLCIRLKQKAKVDRAFMQRLELVSQLRKNVYGLSDLIDGTRHCKCSDPRDRVYALLSLAVRIEGKIDVKPNYTKTISQVYQVFVLKFIHHLKHQDILAQCELRERPTDMPSWVSDWSVPSETNRLLRGFWASGYSASKTHYAGNGTLKTMGVRCTTINKVQHASIFSNEIEDTIDAVRRLIPPEALNSSNSYVGGGTLLDAYCQTLCCGQFGDRYMPPRGAYPDLQKSKEAFRYVLIHKAGCPQYRSSLRIRCWNYVHLFSRGRSFIATKEGYIGLAPGTTMAGDIVCVLLGCSTPLVLRPTGKGQYKIVGDCYVHGLMYNEAVLGPLPKHFQFVWRFNEKRGYWPAYLNRKTGKALLEDPRLGPLPEGWRKQSHSAEQAYSLFVKDRESDVEGTPRDPRLTPEALAARNVDLTVFELV